MRNSSRPLLPQPAEGGQADSVAELPLEKRLSRAERPAPARVAVSERVMPAGTPARVLERSQTPNRHTLEGSTLEPLGTIRETNDSRVKDQGSSGSPEGLNAPLDRVNSDAASSRLSRGVHETGC